MRWHGPAEFRPEGGSSTFDCRNLVTWLHKAGALPKEQSKQERGKELTGEESERGRPSISSSPRASSCH
jgi:hypothetical protein